ncbi:helix-turn-helix domain-containing protein [Paenarthrobacter ureafaciens]|uniref:helix-turn-helix domain-containing protein n=1 Tax=Paenarthrobacter ureafaciens TaxID=37931 RepID=UPI00140CD398
MSNLHHADQIGQILGKPTVTVEELHLVLGIGLRQAYEAVNRGDIPSIRLGKRILISTRVLQDILATGSIPVQAA